MRQLLRQSSYPGCQVSKETAKSQQVGRLRVLTGSFRGGLETLVPQVSVCEGIWLAVFAWVVV